MVFQTSKILQDVRVCLDENSVDTSLIADADEDTLRLEDIIKSKILDAVERVHCEAPYYKLEQGHNLVEDPTSLYWGEKESGWVLLPDDFMRLVVFKMSDWERAVYNVITPEDPKYAMQRSRVKGLRGTTQRPVCALCVRPEGKVLEFYSCKSEGATVSQGVYIPYPEIVLDEQDEEGVDISERCYTSVVYEISALVSVTLGETERAKSLFEMSKTNIQK